MLCPYCDSEIPLAGLSAGQDAVCPACGWTNEDLRSTNRVGCPRCYSAFRAVLLPLLGRFHRHVSHVGRAPARMDMEPSPLAEITQARVALDKAVSGEEFEQAARLRDRIRDLEALLDPGRVEP